MRQVRLIPMAGAGQRFADQGYSAPKPLIDVAGKPMVVRAVAGLPPADRDVFICQTAHLRETDLRAVLLRHFPNASIVETDGLTSGQASTCALARPVLDDAEAVVIGPCDCAITCDREAHARLLAQCDALVWTTRGHPQAAQMPEAYGWVDRAPDGRVRAVSCKAPISDTPESDPLVIGAFSFRRAADLFACIESMQRADRRVNGEFYMDVALDEAVRLGYDVREFPVTSYHSFGTPEELRAYLGTEQ